MKNIIQEQIDKISQEYSSIYSRGDVIKILNTLKDTLNQDSFTEEFLTKVAVAFEEKLESMDSSELVDYSTANFGIESYNEIYIDDIKVKEYNICELLKEAITEAKQY